MSGECCPSCANGAPASYSACETCGVTLCNECDTDGYCAVCTPEPADGGV